jgi:hydroxymethylpyrimidine pyrophosphatase-like HAD family hydrolase
MNTPTFTVILNGSHIEIHQDGVLTHELFPQEAAELAALLTKGVELYWEQYNDDRADEIAERDAFEDAERRYIEQRETENEIAYDRHGYNAF